MTRLHSIALVALVGIAGCTETVAVDAPVAVQIAVLAGGAAVTQPVYTFVPTPPSVRVTDATGAPVAGARVLFVPTRGRGTVGGGDLLTGTDGIATVASWRLGQAAGPQEVTAAVVSSTSDARVTFTGTATPGPTAALAVVPATFVLLPAQTRQLTVNAVDAYGNSTATAVAATFVSQDPAIATVSNGGLVTAVGYGSTTISATYLGQTVNAIVGVGTRPSGTDVTQAPLAGRPVGVAISPQGTLFATRVLSSDVNRFDLPSSAISATVTMTSNSYDIVFDGPGNFAYASLVNGGGLAVINRSTNTVARTINGLEEAFRVRLSPDDAYAFVATSTGKLHRISNSTNAVNTITPGGVLNGMSVNAARGVLYVSNTEGQIHEVSLATFTVVRSTSLGGTPQGIAVSADGNKVYVANEGIGLQIMDAATFAVTNTVGAVNGAYDVILTRDEMEIYVSRPQQGVVTALNASTLVPLRSISGGTPRRMAVSTDGLTLAIGNEGGWVTLVR